MKATHNPIPAKAKAIIKEVASAHGLSVRDVLAKRRTKSHVRCRQEMMARLYTEVGRSSSGRIGGWLGGYDHTTVIHGIKTHYAYAHGFAVESIVMLKICDRRKEDAVQ